MTARGGEPRASDCKDSRQGLYFCPLEQADKLGLTPPAIVYEEQLSFTTVSESENNGE